MRPLISCCKHRKEHISDHLTPAFFSLFRCVAQHVDSSWNKTWSRFIGMWENNVAWLHFQKPKAALLPTLRWTQFSESGFRKFENFFQNVEKVTKREQKNAHSKCVPADYSARYAHLDSLQTTEFWKFKNYLQNFGKVMREQKNVHA